MLKTVIQCIGCLLRGKHNYIYVGRNYNGLTDTGAKEFSLRYICSYCQHFTSISEYEEF